MPRVVDVDGGVIIMVVTLVLNGVLQCSMHNQVYEFSPLTHVNASTRFELRMIRVL